MWWLRNVRVVDPSQNIDDKRDVLVRGDKILAMSVELGWEEVQLQAAGDAIEIVDGEGRYLFPGLIDVHTHLREPGREDKESILTGARAAVRGGFTSILAMANTTPVIDQRGLVEFVRSQGQRAGYARVYPIGAVTKNMEGKELVDMVDLARGGAVAFSDDGRAIANAETMRLALEYAKLTGFPIISHCEDADLAEGGVMHWGHTAARLGVKGIPAAAESVMVARDLLLAALTGGKVHLAHISTKESVELIRWAKQQQIDVSAEVNPHHLLFTDEDLTLSSTELKVNPPLRSSADREALLAGLSDGTIDILATDHAPHTEDEKLAPLAEAPFGIASLEVALAAIWKNLVDKDKLTPRRLIEAWSCVPAQRFGLPGGSLKPGTPADLILFDPNYREIISESNLESKGQNTPFLGWELKGFPVMVWVGGRLVQRDRQIIGVS